MDDDVPMDDLPMEPRPQVRRRICTLCGSAYVEAGHLQEGGPPASQVCADCRMLPEAPEERESEDESIP